MALSSCSEDLSRSIESISFHQKVYDVKVGDTVRLGYGVSPSGISPRIMLESSNEGIASVVSERGLVRGVSRGNAVISVKGIYGGAVATNACEVRVSDVEATSITLAEHEKELNVGDEYTPSYVITPDNSSQRTVSVTSDNESVAMVEDGVVKAVSAGNANIVVAIAGTSLSDTCELNVSNVEVSDIVLSQTDVSIERGKTFALQASVLPENATFKMISWSSSDNSIATVNDGVIQANKIGNCVIYAKSIDGKVTAECNVKVIPVKVTAVTVEKFAKDLALGAQYEISYNVTPRDADDKRVTVSSDNQSVATVEDRYVIAKGIGEANITVTTLDGNFSASTTVKVRDITELMELDYAMGTKVDLTGAYFYKSFSIKNNSMNDVILEGVEIINNNTGNLVASEDGEDLRGVLSPDESRGITLTSRTGNIPSNLTVFWYFRFNGKAYAVSKRIN